MPQHSSDHTRHASNALQEDKPREPFPLRHLELGLVFLAWRWVTVSRYKIHSPPQHTHGPEGNPVGPILCLPMGNGDFFHLGFGVARPVSSGRIITVCIQSNLHWMDPGSFHLLDVGLWWRREVFLDLLLSRG